MLTCDTVNSPYIKNSISASKIAGKAFLAGYANQNTRRPYGYHLGGWFRFCEDLGLDPLVVQRVHVELWLRSLETEGLKSSTRALKLGVVRQFYRYCCDEGWIEKTPVEKVKGPVIPRRSTRSSLNRTQLADLVEGAHKISPIAHAVIMLLGFNGLRIGETCAANVEDIIYEGFSPVLKLPNRKGGKEGVAALSRPVEAALFDCIEKRTEGPLFLNTEGRRIRPASVQLLLDQAKFYVRGHVPRLTPHVLRHTWVTLAVEAGASLSRIQYDGNWSDQRMVGYYCHSQNDPLGSASHLVAAHVLSM